jgi:glycerol-1-phosphate dehydrogenase [NAD(P)+]
VTNHRSDVLSQLLGSGWPDPDGGGELRFRSLSVVIAPTLRDREADLVRSLGLGRNLAVVSDHITNDVLGARVEHALATLGSVIPVVLDRPHADAATVERLRNACASADALVAVGSGTINDLCKAAAAADGKRHVVFPTAPSMNGYASANAAITVDGHKQSLAAALPCGIFIDLAVLAQAPARMIRAGVGDSICRSTAQADWMLSRAIRSTPYREAPFAMLAPDEPRWIEAPEALLRGDLQAMGALARTLVLSGLGMTLCEGSYPASQGEHLISHYIDMFAPQPRDAFLHGEQVGVATLTMARIQQALLDGASPAARATRMTRDGLRTRFGQVIGDSCWDQFEAKRLTEAGAAQRSRHLVASWEAIRDAVRGVLIPAEEVRGVLRRIGAPLAPSDIGLSGAFYADAVRNARYLRDRYTFLDLADDAGRLDALAAA